MRPAGQSNDHRLFCRDSRTELKGRICGLRVKNSIYLAGMPPEE